MNKMIACCGINCETCEARIATIKDDDKMRAEVAKKWVRTCVATQGYKTCADCPDKDTCKKVGAIWENCAEAKENLEAMCY
jgi:hypothetical protein